MCKPCRRRAHSIRQSFAHSLICRCTQCVILSNSRSFIQFFRFVSLRCVVLRCARTQLKSRLSRCLFLFVCLVIATLIVNVCVGVRVCGCTCLRLPKVAISRSINCDSTESWEKDRSDCAHFVCLSRRPWRPWRIMSHTAHLYDHSYYNRIE